MHIGAPCAIAGNLVLRERTKRKREGKEEEKDGQLADEAQRLCVGNLTELASLLAGTARLFFYVYTSVYKHNRVLFV